MTSIADRSGAGVVAGSEVGDRPLLPGGVDDRRDSTDRRYRAIGSMVTASG